MFLESKGVSVHLTWICAYNSGRVALDWAFCNCSFDIFTQNSFVRNIGVIAILENELICQPVSFLFIYFIHLFFFSRRD